MSASEALTIWMLSTAMKAPSVAPITASQVFAETAGAAAGTTVGSPSLAELMWTVVCSGVIFVCSRPRAHSFRSGLGAARREPLLGLALGDRGRFGVDSR